MMESITQFLSTTLSSNSGNIPFHHFLFSMFVAYAGGFLSSLTPCVYPMIPITVSVVGGIGSQKRSWRTTFLRGCSYVFGMMVIYSFLGVLAGLSGRVFGSFTNNSTWYLVLGLIMTLSALIMLEVIPFDIPAWWEQLKWKIHHYRHQRAQRQGRGTHHLSHSEKEHVQEEMTFLGSFILGASSGFIAAPCTTPVLTSILTYIANTQSVGFGFALMLSFSLGLGTLLLIIATFTGALQNLPRSGRWMKAVKILSGLILLAFAEYLIYRAGNFGGS